MVGFVVVAGLGFVGLSALGMARFMSHDRIELIERNDVVDQAERACGAMARDLRSLGSDRLSDSGALAARIREENASAERFVAKVREVGRDALADDVPADQWLSDWERIVEVRATYADRLETSPAVDPPDVPTEAGRPITQRMNDVGVACAVPGQLLDDFD